MKSVDQEYLNNRPRCRTRRDRTWIFTSPGSGKNFYVLYRITLFINSDLGFLINQPKLILGFLISLCNSCSSATNRLITSKDHASVQINIGHLDENGNYTGQFTTFALCGFVRAQVIFIPIFIQVSLEHTVRSWGYYSTQVKLSVLSYN